MQREVDDANPYEANISDPLPEPVSELASHHEWRGRTLTVEAKAMPSYAYLGTQYFVTLDEGQQFTSTKMTLIEHFDWQFEHEGRTVTGRFAAEGLNNGFARRYRIWIDNELLAESKVRIKDAWKGLAIAAGFGFIGWVAIAAFFMG